MILKKWDDLPNFMRCDEVKVYYDLLAKKQIQLFLKRIFDIIVASVMLLIVAIPMLVIAVLIKMDSSGPVFYRQERVTKYGKRFRIHKFRTMVDNADKIGSAVTIERDNRITKIGNKIRNLRIDELPQLIDIIEGNMTFVGTRPEAVKYVEQYKPEYYATLLIPAGVTSETSIEYKNEDALLRNAINADDVYIYKILPDKMVMNLNSLKEFCFVNDIKTIIRTVYAVFIKK